MRKTVQIQNSIKKLWPNSELTEDQAQKLGLFAELIDSWNRKINLSGYQGTEQILERLVADALAPWVLWQQEPDLPKLQGRGLDMGSGSGVPGLVLATMFKGLEITCIDGVGKKTMFQQTAIGQMGLNNAQALHGRIEDLQQQPEHRAKYDWIFAKALADCSSCCALAAPLLAKQGHLLLWKSPHWQQEADCSTSPLSLVKELNYRLGNGSQAVLLLLKKQP